jgi:hypothetical protein
VTTEQVQKAGIEDFHQSVKDFSAPTQDQIDEVLRFIRKALGSNKPVAVSCGAGYGRTGTILGCYLVSRGFPAEDAIEHLINVRPVSKEILQVPGQKPAIVEFARRLSWAETYAPVFNVDLTEREGTPIGAGIAFWRTTELDKSRGYPDGLTLSADRGAHGAELHLTPSEALNLVREISEFLDGPKS